jgi:hypothetical protein
MMAALNILAVESVERRLEFARLPSGWASIAAIVTLSILLLAVVFFYTHEQRSGASVRVRRLLAGMRCMVIVLLAVIWLEPILATYLHRRSDAYTLVLLDSSASMSLPDRYADPTEAVRVQKVLDTLSEREASHPSRWALVREVIGGKGRRLLEGLAAKNSVRVMRFGDTPAVLGQVEIDRDEKPAAMNVPAPSTSQPSGEANARDQEANARDKEAKASSDPVDSLRRRISAVEPNMPVTDLGRAIRHAVESVGSNPVAGIVVISDGRFNHGEPVEVAAQYARDKRIAVYAVGIGDPSPPRNIAVAAIEAPPNVFVQDPFKVTAHLRTEGLDGESLTVELLDRTAGQDASKVIDTRQVQVPAGGQVPPLVFSHKIDEAAEDRLAVRIVPHELETIAEDNIKEVTVRALANKMRVLLVAGGPNWEYRYLSRLLERDKTADVSCWLQSADERAIRDGNTVIDHFPREPAELAEYDCIVLLDPEAGDIDSAWSAEVEKLVSERGCGLLYVAGRQSTPRLVHEPQVRGLLDLLPVVFDPGAADLVLNELGHFQRTEWSVLLPPSAMGSSVLAMSDRAEETEQIWPRLGGVYWHYPVRREKPVATVLLRHSNPAMHNAYGSHVLLASQFVGSGRTGYLGFDTTWRWRRYGDSYFNRFWIQLLRHMVEGKLLSGQRRGFIQVERAETSIGEPANVEARLLDVSFQPLAQSDVTAVITVEGAAAGQIAMKAQPNRPGWYRGQFIPTRLGTHTLRIDLPADRESDKASIRGELKVGRPDLEFRNASLDRDALELLASRSAGGSYLHVDEIDRLIEMIPSKVTTLVLTGQPTSLWDRWWVMLALVLLLGAEWFVRKRVHLL